MSLNGAQGAGMSWRDVGGLYMKLEEERVDMGARGETGEWMRFQGVKLCPGSQIEWSREPARKEATRRIATTPEEHDPGSQHSHISEQHSSQEMTWTAELKVMFRFRGKGGRFDVSAQI